MWPFSNHWKTLYFSLEGSHEKWRAEISASRREITRLQEAHSIAMDTIKLLRTELQTHKNYTHKDPKTGKFTKDKPGG
jgi:hypothetical protein